MTQVTNCYGPPGSGKTRKLLSFFLSLVNYKHLDTFEECGCDDCENEACWRSEDEYDEDDELVDNPLWEGRE